MQASELQHVGSVVAAPGLWSTGSAAAVHALSCSTACGIVPDQGLNPCLLHGQVDSLPLSPQESPKFLDLNYCTMVIKENVLMLRKHTEVVRVKEA